MAVFGDGRDKDLLVDVRPLPRRDPSAEFLPTTKVTFPDARELLSALTSVSSAQNKPLADVTFSSSGVTVISVNAANTFQSSVFLSRKLFDQFTVSREVTQISFDLSTLVFALRLFISADAGVGVVMQYPGPHQELMVRSNNVSTSTENHTTSIDLSMHTQYQNEKFLPTLFASIETAGVFGGSANLLEHMGDTMVATVFSDRGQLFREAVEDLGVGSKVARLELRDRPAQMTLSAAAPDIEMFVDVPVHELTGFTCSLASVEYRYNLKHLLTALSASPNKRGSGEVYVAEEHHTGLYVDAQGMMKVTHMWSTRERQQLHEVGGGEEGGDETGLVGKQERMVATMFFLMSLADEDDGDEARAAMRGIGMDGEASIQSSRM